VEEFAACDQYTLQGDAFSRAVREGGPVPVPLEDSVRNMAVIDALLLRRRPATGSPWDRPPGLSKPGATRSWCWWAGWHPGWHPADRVSLGPSGRSRLAGFAAEPVFDRQKPHQAMPECVNARPFFRRQLELSSAATF